MAAKPKKSAAPAAPRAKAAGKRSAPRPDKRDDNRSGVPGARASQDRRLRFAELLLGISQKMSGMDTLDEVLTSLVEVTTVELKAERGTLFLNDPETSELYSRVA